MELNHYLTNKICIFCNQQLENDKFYHNYSNIIEKLNCYKHTPSISIFIEQNNVIRLTITKIGNQNFENTNVIYVIYFENILSKKCILGISNDEPRYWQNKKNLFELEIDILNTSLNDIDAIANSMILFQ
jgi:hypothetical protein